MVVCVAQGCSWHLTVLLPSAFEGFPRAVSSIVFARWNPHIPLPIQFLPCQHVYKIKYFWCPVLAPPWATFAGSACFSFLYSFLYCFMRSSLKIILIVNLSLAVESLLHVDRSLLVSTYPEEEMCRAKHWWQGPAVRTACISVRFSFGLLQVWFPGLNFKQCLGDINQLLRHIFQFNITWEEPRSVLLSPSEMYEGLLGGTCFRNMSLGWAKRYLNGSCLLKTAFYWFPDCSGCPKVVGSDLVTCVGVSVVWTSALSWSADARSGQPLHQHIKAGVGASASRNGPWHGVETTLSWCKLLSWWDGKGLQIQWCVVVLTYSQSRRFGWIINNFVC